MTCEVLCLYPESLANTSPPLSAVLFTMTTSHQLQADHGQERRCSVQVSSHMSQSNTTEGELQPEYNYYQNYIQLSTATRLYTTRLQLGNEPSNEDISKLAKTLILPGCWRLASCDLSNIQHKVESNMKPFFSDFFTVTLPSTRFLNEWPK